MVTASSAKIGSTTLAVAVLDATSVTAAVITQITCPFVRHSSNISARSVS